MSSEAEVPASAPVRSSTPKPGVLGKMEHLVSEYGPIAFGTYFVIFGMTWAGFATALAFGLKIGSSAAGGASLAGASWLATKVTQPLRIGATAVLTPVVAGFTRRGKKAPPSSAE